MTLTESINSLLEELTDDNQGQLLPILADMLADAERHNEEQALRWALTNNKRPNQFRTDSFHSTHCWRPTTQESMTGNYNGHLPHHFQRNIRHSNARETMNWAGRYFSSLQDAWKAYLETAVKHYHLLQDEK